MKRFSELIAALMIILYNTVVNAANDGISSTAMPSEAPTASAAPHMSLSDERVYISITSLIILVLLIAVVIKIISKKKHNSSASDTLISYASGSSAINRYDNIPDNVRSDTSMTDASTPGLKMHLARISSHSAESYDAQVNVPIILGSSPSQANIVLDSDPSIRPKHCMIASERNKLVLLDHSPNTWVNGIPVQSQRYVFNNGDKLRIGNTTLRITWK